jgi:hypothetical protein
MAGPQPSNVAISRRQRIRALAPLEDHALRQPDLMAARDYSRSHKRRPLSKVALGAGSGSPYPLMSGALMFGWADAAPCPRRHSFRR